MGLGATMPQVSTAKEKWDQGIDSSSVLYIHLLYQTTEIFLWARVHIVA